MLDASTMLRTDRRRASREREARRGKLGRQRFLRLAHDLAGVIRLARAAGILATPLGLEGPLRASMRAELCLAGWGWSAADLVARDLLAEVEHRLNIDRPSWAEGQPDWTGYNGLILERTRCANCAAPLPQGHTKFCSGICKAATYSRINRIMQTREDRAIGAIST